MSDPIAGRAMSKWNSCERKKTHATEAKALKKAEKMGTKHKKKFKVYRCGHCGYWHLGTKITSTMRKIKQYFRGDL